jgi:D-sedoheptulose 7-phosphate isomerase
MDKYLKSERKNIDACFSELLDVLSLTLEREKNNIEKSISLICRALENKKKLLICGNGGSAAESQHFAAELVGRFKMKREGIPAIALTADTSLITALGNDFGFDTIFAKQVETLGSEGDVLCCLSTSGTSKNIIMASLKAKEKNIHTISLLGKDGGRIKEMSDVSIVVPSQDTARIQEAHLLIIHVICQLIEKYLFPSRRNSFGF